MGVESSGHVDLPRFGEALNEALVCRRVTQTVLAEAMGSSQSAVSGWVNGKAEPAPQLVFQLERYLRLTPGHLSRFLGYLPTAAVGAVPTIEDAIVHSNTLDDELKPMLLAVYRAVADRPRKRRR